MFLQAFYYDGTVQCFTGQHLILAIPSLILFAVVVALPGFVILISFKRYKVSCLISFLFETELAQSVC